MQEAKMVRLIYSLYLDGYTDTKIRDELNNNHIQASKVKGKSVLFEFKNSFNIEFS